MAKDKSLKKAKGFFAEFKEFAITGNLFDMAIGVIIGGVFKDLVGSFTNNIIMPIISIFTGGVNFDEWKIKLPTIFQTYEQVEQADGSMKDVLVENYLTFGTFLSAVISFLILMLVVFLMVKAVNKLREKAKKKAEEEKEAEPDPEPSAEEKLLTEIRDLLKEK